jgi:NADPH:quinone reductase-like Zn-dependent oxidoreductase
MRQIRVTQYGGPEQMRLVELSDPIPAPGQALVRVTVGGVNYMGAAARSMPLPGWGLPAAIGVEGAGRVEAIGDGVENLAPATRSPGSTTPAATPSTSLSPPEAASRTRSGNLPAGAAPTSSTTAAVLTPSAPPSWRYAVTACTSSTGT